MIYIFSFLEFQILAASRGMEQYYGFFPEKQADAQEIGFAVYTLVREGILKKDHTGLVLQEPMAGYMEEIAAARTMLLFDRRGLPSQCLYPPKTGEHWICLENSMTDAEALCLSALEKQELLQQMRDLNQLPAPRLDSEMGAYDFEQYWDVHIPGSLWEVLRRGVEVPTQELLEQELVAAIYTRRNAENGEILERMALLDLPMEYCMVFQRPGDGLEWKNYSQEEIYKLLDRCRQL